MNSTLYISNLAPSATEQALSARFVKCGSVVSVRIETNAATGRSKGFGYVEMATRADALTAINRLNLSDFEGRLMSVNMAHTGVPG